MMPERMSFGGGAILEGKVPVTTQSSSHVEAGLQTGPR